MKTVSTRRVPVAIRMDPVEAVLSLIRRMRGRHLIVLDTIGLVLGILIAIVIAGHDELTLEQLARYLPVALIPVVVRLAVNIRFGLYQRLWVHASVPDLAQVTWAVGAGTVIAIPLVGLALIVTGMTPGALLTPGFWFLELLVALAVIGGDRFAIRAVSDIATTRGAGEKANRVPALLFGAGREGAIIVRSALRAGNAKVLPVGFLDSDASRHGSSIAGLQVYGGLDSLEDAIRRTGARMLLITMTNAPGTAVRRVMAAAQAAGLEVRRVPAVNELLDGSLDPSRIRRIRVEDLLTREQVTVHAPGVDHVIRDQVVMVTGAGGSIGSELARQIFAFEPRKLILVDRAESPLYMIERELDLRALAGKGTTELSVHLANVVSRPAMARLIEANRPSVIFHAAACKHVPMMEEHPSESVHVNVAGTQAVLDAAIAADVERFVLVSTDKAVEPTSVMGATKRLAEWLVAEAAIQTSRPYVAVRFGNVLGSAGSVLPVFERQLERGEPLTITHPDMTRYFMTIQEAGWLILDASAIGAPGDLFVLDMGEPVRILDMARDLIRLAGQDPAEVPIVFTGLRPGEKLSEKLYYDAETVADTDMPKIRRVLDPQPPPDVRRVIRELMSMAGGDREPELRDALFAGVAGRDLSLHAPETPEPRRRGPSPDAPVPVPAQSGSG
jgi:FlaA1/EpsC-like NDP-sugar epimerase